jgi:hypothetical protein
MDVFLKLRASTCGVLFKNSGKVKIGVTLAAAILLAGFLDGLYSMLQLLAIRILASGFWALKASAVLWRTKLHNWQNGWGQCAAISRRGEENLTTLEGWPWMIGRNGFCPGTKR